jgi:hypothetical protein
VLPEKELEIEEENSEFYLTLDSPDRVNTRLSLAQCLIDKLRKEVSSWSYSLGKKKIVYL